MFMTVKTSFKDYYFEAAKVNTSVCEWSPCGRYILTATTSPRLRVDNGCKARHASDKLVYLKDSKNNNRTKHDR